MARNTRNGKCGSHEAKVAYEIDDVEKIINKRVINGKVEYLLKLADCAIEESVWDREDRITRRDLVDEFEESLDKKPNKKVDPTDKGKGLTAEKVVGFTQSGGVNHFLVLFTNQMARLLTEEEVRAKHMDKLIEFYEENLKDHGFTFLE